MYGIYYSVGDTDIICGDMYVYTQDIYEWYTNIKITSQREKDKLAFGLSAFSLELSFLTLVMQQRYYILQHLSSI
jgi:hypothetical protein